LLQTSQVLGPTHEGSPPAPPVPAAHHRGVWVRFPVAASRRRR
jgi:hypothetical protein